MTFQLINTDTGHLVAQGSLAVCIAYRDDLYRFHRQCNHPAPKYDIIPKKESTND